MANEPGGQEQVPGKTYKENPPNPKASANRIRYIRDATESTRKDVQKNLKSVGTKDNPMDKGKPFYYSILHKWFRDKLADKQQAEFDNEVTGLRNRKGFTDRINFEIARYHRAKSQLERDGKPNEIPYKLALAFIDLNGLKAINDTQGHAGGNAFLKKAADILTQTSRETDTVARLGGDEFVVLLPQSTIEQAQEVWWKNLQNLSEKEKIFFSVGLEEIDVNNWEASLKRADNAMYIAKAEGKEAVAKGAAERKSTMETYQSSRKVLEEKPNIESYNEGR